MGGLLCSQGHPWERLRGGEVGWLLRRPPDPVPHREGPRDSSGTPVRLVHGPGGRRTVLSLQEASPERQRDPGTQTPQGRPGLWGAPSPACTAELTSSCAGHPADPGAWDTGLSPGGVTNGVLARCVPRTHP